MSNKTRSLTFGDQLNILNNVLHKFGGRIVSLNEGEGVSASELDAWLKYHEFAALPADVVDFLKVCNGFSLRWALPGRRNDTDAVKEIQLGHLNINKLNQITSVTLEPDECSPFSERGARVRVFALDSSNQNQLVALVYLLPHYLQKSDQGANQHQGKPEIWFRDVCHSWHFVSSSFSSYVRLMIEHIGIKGWQYIFTTEGVDIETETWFRLLIPERCKISLDRLTVEEIVSNGQNSPRCRKPLDLSYLDQIGSRYTQHSQNMLSQKNKYTIEAEKKDKSNTLYSRSKVLKAKRKKSYDGSGMYAVKQTSATAKSRPLSAPLRKPRPMVPVRINGGSGTNQKGIRK